jgi:hypothetical protein
MRHSKRIVTGALVAVGAVGAIASVAAVNDDGDDAVTGRDAERATAAALRLTHGGTANSVERDSENGATWEVEVTRTDGTTVDVRLDESFRKVVIEGDSEQG